jgi:hypothetical protein
MEINFKEQILNKKDLKCSDDKFKDLVRRELNSQIHYIFPPDKRRSSFNVFTLAGENFSLEKTLKQTYKDKVNLFSVEQDSNIFQKQLALSTKYNLNMEIRNKKDIDYFKDCLYSFDAIWLDWCSCLTNQKLETLEILFKNNLLDQDLSILSITLMKAREQNISFFKDLQKHQLDYGRKYLIPTEINKIAKKYGYNIAPSVYICYCDRVESKSAPMITYFFYVSKDSLGGNFKNVSVRNMIGRNEEFKKPQKRSQDD